MPTYKCTNSECEAFNRESHLGKTRIVQTASGVMDMNQTCPKCGMERETVKNDGYTTNVSSPTTGNVPIR